MLRTISVSGCGHEMFWDPASECIHPLPSGKEGGMSGFKWVFIMFKYNSFKLVIHMYPEFILCKPFIHSFV